MRYQYTGGLRGYMPQIGLVGPEAVIDAQDLAVQQAIDAILQEDSEAGRPATFVLLEDSDALAAQPVFVSAYQGSEGDDE